ncbi:uncharacterized protein LOC107647702 [Arachis ipaensis]|uniref:uncharacterized protein LOC107647702 n=1 Tax=Arachis ipaensis TaxID=130454 RepID=UPI0007AF9319|nr:uncharacterized protein LOC107647702 [Arachis ipaensis]XP_025662194.1 uncharacterized protein LOC112757859 [Arachis hypogaea]
MVRADASVSIKVLLNATTTYFGFRPTYRRVWLVKQKAVAHIYGDWDESYNELPRWVLGVQLTMPGTVAVLRTSPVRVGGQVDDSQAYFHRLFWTFPPCIEAFRHCKPLVSIDGTHLYGKYGGTLLVAITQDGNSNILPVAFALVEGENVESWSFFLSHLRQYVTPQSANFALTFKGKDAKRLLVNACYAKTEVEFDYWFDILRSEDPAMCEWANRIEYSLWTQHRDEGRRFGHITTNISECVNSNQESPGVLVAEGYLWEVGRTIHSQGERGRGPVRNRTTIQSTSGEVYRGQSEDGEVLHGDFVRQR